MQSKAMYQREERNLMKYLENSITGTKVIWAGFEKDLVEWLAASLSP